MSLTTLGKYMAIGIENCNKILQKQMDYEPAIDKVKHKIIKVISISRKKMAALFCFANVKQIATTTK